ncbi:hypothetical protein G7B40_034580 [Aetokthonos hydrillicola Thurmond2011]|jgi:hypothetical protein|uniref:Uncharacterized protein n=1 Tax=Aetokthonos hydrillicola Thurmond2011 TaxID=2712845 RepID=A0AAP5IDK1_9CYAN|nr:hypothetical protein [Aetokthonos hydrillicola CCALA 1050]MDR9899648.1 hypothetical protein [Aetokthonos hydrillicola Thurmond2011]
MAKKELHIRITERRMHKLQLYAAEKDKTMTQVIEELLDTLPEPKRENVTQP